MNNLESISQCEASTVGTQCEIMEIKEDIVVEIPETSSPVHNVQSKLSQKSRATCIELYQAALKGDWKEAYITIGKQENIVRDPITSKKNTALHIAVAAKHKEFVRSLLGELTSNDLTFQNEDGNTSLCLAAASGVVEIAKMLVNLNATLPDIPGSQKMTPIHIAALFGHGEMVRYLQKKTDIERLSNTHLRNLFHAIISADIYDVALWMWGKMKMSTEVLTLSPNNEETALHLMARKPSAISHKSQLNLFQNLANSIFKGFYQEAKMRTLAHQLVEELWKSVLEFPVEKFTNLLSEPSELLFDAAESGNVEFLVIVIRLNPDIIWKANGKSLSLFHTAAVNRHESIFNIIHEFGGIKDLIACYKEVESNDHLLHLVARLPPPNRLHVVSGAALQMQRELIWFKAAKEIVPRSYIKIKNKKGEIADELFTEEHENLRKEGEKWMKETATACMLVATLIATVVFAAAFTLPGGNDETKPGYPQFRKEFLFDLFLLSNLVALLSSVTAIMIFLSILISRYAEDDFRMALPAKLMVGLLALFVSIISMVLAFTAAMILIRDNEQKWSLVFIISLASLAATSFALLHFELWFDTLRSAYLSKFLFHGAKRGIFH